MNNRTLAKLHIPNGLSDIPTLPATVSILAEIPESVHEKLIAYLEVNPQADQDSVFTVALTKFLQDYFSQ